MSTIRRRALRLLALSVTLGVPRLEAQTSEPPPQAEQPAPQAEQPPPQSGQLPPQAEQPPAQAEQPPAQAEQPAPEDEQPPVSEPAGPPANVVDDLIRQGDEAMARLEPAAAFQAYQTAVTRNPSNYEALWKSGRTLLDLGELEKRGNSQKDKYNKALKYAERAIKVNPDGAEGHFVRAYALGRVALFEGGKTKIRLSREVKVEALRAIDLDPLNDGAYNLMGRWNYDIADLNFVERTIAKTILGGVPEDASFDSAAHYYELAIQANPNHVAHYLEYARTLLRLDRDEDARVALQKAIDLPSADLDDGANKDEARALLEKLG